MKKINFIIVALICMAGLLGNLTIANAQSPTPQPGTITQGDKFVIANTIHFSSGDILNGSLGLVGSTAIIDRGATVIKSVFVVGSTITINGAVAGDIIAIGGAINLGDTAMVDGDITIIGASLTRSPMAVVKGKITQQAPTIVDINPAVPAPQPVSSVGKIASLALQSFLVAAIAAIVALLIPNPIKRIGTALAEQPAIAMGVGLLVIIGSIVLMILMVISIILIPVAFLAVLAFFLTLFFGWFSVGYELGYKIGELFHAEWAPAVASGIGTLILTLVISAVGLIPWAGWLIMSLAILLVILLGIGSVVMARFGSPKYRPVPRMPGHTIDTSSTQPSA